MGLRQDETSDALKLAFAAGVLSSSTVYAIPIPVPIVCFPAPIFNDLMNPTKMKPFTTFTPFTPIPSFTKVLRPPYVSFPFYTITPFQSLQRRLHPPQWIPSPQTLTSIFWDVVKRTAEHSVYGAAGFAWLLSEIVKETPEKDQTLVRDGQELPWCDSFDLSFLSSTPAEDDLLRVDLSELETLSSSELYFDEAEFVTCPAPASHQFPTSVQSSTFLRSFSSDTSVATVLGASFSAHDLSTILQIPDDELYFDLEDLGKLCATPPWPFRTSALASPHTISD